MNKAEFKIAKFNCDYAKTLLDKAVHQGESEQLGFAVLTLWSAVHQLVAEAECKNLPKHNIERELLLKAWEVLDISEPNHKVTEKIFKYLTKVKNEKA